MKTSKANLKKPKKHSIFKVIASLLYGCETWRMTKTGATKLDIFLYKRLRRLMKIYWPSHENNR